MPSFLSFDVGSRSLSVCLIKIDLETQPKTRARGKTTPTVSALQALQAPAQCILKHTNIVYWETIDILRDNQSHISNAATTSNDILVQNLIKTLFKRLWLVTSDYTVVDYILIENQLVQRQTRHRKQALGSVANKVLSYAIYSFYYMIYTLFLKKKCPKMQFVSPSLKLDFDLLQVLWPRIVAFDYSGHKASVACASGDGAGSAGDAGSAAGSADASELKQTQDQKYRQRKKASVDYTSQILMVLKGRDRDSITSVSNDSKVKTVSNDSKVTNDSKVKIDSKDTSGRDSKLIHAKIIDNTITTYYCQLYLDHVQGENKLNLSRPGRKFHHSIDDEGLAKDRRSDLGDCFLQSLMFYVRNIYNKRSKKSRQNKNE